MAKTRLRNTRTCSPPHGSQPWSGAGVGGADYWRVVIVDEAHHLKAATFDQFVRSVRPQLLLGLTATPERADGKKSKRLFLIRDRMARLQYRCDSGMH
ncbi:DEAD/DEAH box helicase family protein [Undibacterium arcticum]